LEQRTHKKVQLGVVTSIKMDKTITVKVERRLPHPVYKKFLTRSKKFLAHDAENTCREGDRVRIIECRPLSALKRWRLLEIVERKA
jgi:small subunit ribosomal protein S17